MEKKEYLHIYVFHNTKYVIKKILNDDTIMVQELKNFYKIIKFLDNNRDMGPNSRKIKTLFYGPISNTVITLIYE